MLMLPLPKTSAVPMDVLPRAFVTMPEPPVTIVPVWVMPLPAPVAVKDMPLIRALVSSAVIPLAMTLPAVAVRVTSLPVRVPFAVTPVP
jgi:hypothetical protein